MIVLSHLGQRCVEALVNHRHYAECHGYRHIVVDASGAQAGWRMRALQRYTRLLNTLRHAEPDDLVLLLSEDSAVVHAVPLDTLMAGRDWLLVCTGTQPLPQIDVQIWRNTEAVRERVRQLTKRCCLAEDDTYVSEAAILHDFDAPHFSHTIDGVHPVMQAGAQYDPAWVRYPTFALSIDETPEQPEQKGSFPRFREALLGHINRAVVTQASLTPFAATPVTLTDLDQERSTYQPGRPIALIMLYTPNIAPYAHIAEASLRNYCARHGYTLYVHRDLPREIGLDASGNWFKPWLLHAYLQHHEWVLWIDADVLINHQTRKLEPLLEGRDWLLAQDPGQWDFNSGIMGFRNTAQNDALLWKIAENIAALSDHSTVYRHGGDQHFFIAAMQASGLLSLSEVCDLVEINTPWPFRQPDSFMVHYLGGMWYEMRALMMAHDFALGPAHAGV